MLARWHCHSLFYGLSFGIICCSLGNVPLEPTPGVFSFWTLVMIRVFIRRSAVMPNGHHCILHCCYVMSVLPVGLSKINLVYLFFCLSVSLLHLLVCRQLKESCPVYFWVNVGVNPNASVRGPHIQVFRCLHLHRQLLVLKTCALLSPSPRNSTYRMPWPSTDRWKMFRIPEASIDPEDPSKFAWHSCWWPSHHSWNSADLSFPLHCIHCMHSFDITSQSRAFPVTVESAVTTPYDEENPLFLNVPSMTQQCHTSLLH